VNGLSPGARDVAMVFQSYALYPHMSVRENLAFPLEVAKVGKQAIADRVKEVAGRLGIEALLDRKPKALSGGQRQRVALGRALVRRPKVFLFDEPLSNLDAALRVQVRGELKKLHEELKATFLYVTHDQAEAMTLSDRIVLLHAGRVQQVGSPMELYQKPANTFVAEFFGAPKINLVPAAHLGLPGGEGVLVGIRPEDLEVGLGEPPQGAQSGDIYLVEPMGSETYVTLRTPTCTLNARGPGGFTAASGAKAWARFDPAKVLKFDAATGKAL
jgi:multiple sugar transport system ATP-binding protein